MRNNYEYESDSNNSESGKSEFDEEYYNLKPPTIPFDTRNRSIVKIRAGQYSDLQMDRDSLNKETSRKNNILLEQTSTSNSVASSTFYNSGCTNKEYQESRDSSHKTAKENNAFLSNTSNPANSMPPPLSQSQQRTTQNTKKRQKPRNVPNSSQHNTNIPEQHMCSSEVLNRQQIQNLFRDNSKHNPSVPILSSTTVKQSTTSASTNVPSSLKSNNKTQPLPQIINANAFVDTSIGPSASASSYGLQPTHRSSRNTIAIVRTDGALRPVVIQPRARISTPPPPRVREAINDDIPSETFLDPRDENYCLKLCCFSSCCD